LLSQKFQLGRHILANRIVLPPMVSRLADHKGVGLIVSVIDEIMSRDVILIILGKGEKKYEEFFENLRCFLFLHLLLRE